MVSHGPTKLVIPPSQNANVTHSCLGEPATQAGLLIPGPGCLLKQPICSLEQHVHLVGLCLAELQNPWLSNSSVSGKWPNNIFLLQKCDWELEWSHCISPPLSQNRRSKDHENTSGSHGWWYLEDVLVLRDLNPLSHGHCATRASWERCHSFHSLCACYQSLTQSTSNFHNDLAKCILLFSMHGIERLNIWLRKRVPDSV